MASSTDRAAELSHGESSTHSLGSASQTMASRAGPLRAEGHRSASEMGSLDRSEGGSSSSGRAGPLRSECHRSVSGIRNLERNSGSGRGKGCRLVGKRIELDREERTYSGGETSTSGSESPLPFVRMTSEQGEGRETLRSTYTHTHTHTHPPTMLGSPLAAPPPRAPTREPKLAANRVRGDADHPPDPIGLDTRGHGNHSSGIGAEQGGWTLVQRRKPPIRFEGLKPQGAQSATATTQRSLIRTQRNQLKQGEHGEQKAWRFNSGSASSWKEICKFGRKLEDSCKLSYTTPNQIRWESGCTDICS